MSWRFLLSKSRFFVKKILLQRPGETVFITSSLTQILVGDGVGDIPALDFKVNFIDDSQFSLS
jgi:hypothetical protein